MKPKNKWIVKEYDEFEDEETTTGTKHKINTIEHIQALENTLSKEREEKEELQKQLKELQKRIEELAEKPQETNKKTCDDLLVAGLGPKFVEKYEEHKKSEKVKKEKVKKSKVKKSKVKKESEEKPIETVEYKDKTIKNKKDLVIFFD